jgi:pentatricopeptide repeat protein
MPIFSLPPLLTLSFSVPKPKLNHTNSLHNKCRDGSLKEILGILHDRSHRGLPIDPDTYAALLQACVDIHAFSESKQVHAHILINGFEENLFLGFKLVSMYAQSGNISDARQVFDKIHERGVIIWNAIIRGYGRKGLCEEVLRLYYQMQQEGIKPDNFTFPIVLKACAGLSALQEGKEIHHHIIRNGLESDVYVCTALVDMYSKCGGVEAACQVFDQTSKRDVVSWSAMISGLAQNGFANEALTVFHQMQLADIKPNAITMVSVLSACAHLADLQQGKWIHDYIIRSGFELNISVETALMDMYAKCGRIELARQLFDKMSTRDVISWNAMIAGYVQNGQAIEAVRLFRRMEMANLKPNSATIVSVLPACGHLTSLHEGKKIHDYIIRNGLESDVSVGNCLVAMYAKFGKIEVARKFFLKMYERDVVSWNAMIVGYTQNGLANEALALFHEMQLGDVKPNYVTMVSVLPACAYLAARQQGMWIHVYTIKRGMGLDVSVGNALVDMYAKCGNLRVARQMFDRMLKKDKVSWSIMIAAYGMHGHGEDATELFTQMQQVGIKPDHVTFISVLSACSRAGLVDEGLRYFECMSQDYGIAPTLEHCACIVDLLGRAGHMKEALTFIRQMPIEPDAGVWGALLGACRIHHNIKLGKHVAKHLIKLEPENAANYVLLSNIYATAGRWDEVM